MLKVIQIVILLMLFNISINSTIIRRVEDCKELIRYYDINPEIHSISGWCRIFRYDKIEQYSDFSNINKEDKNRLNKCLCKQIIKDRGL